MRKFTILFVAAAIVVAGCGGSSKKSTPAGSNTGTTAKGGTNNTTAGSGDSEYDKLVDKASKARIRVTYKTSGSGGQDSFLTLSQDGTGKVAYFTDDGDSQVIVDGDTYINCSNVKTTAECTQSSGAVGKAYAGAFTALFAAPLAAITAAKGVSGFGDTSSETIAGRDASCVSLNYLAGKWKSCADKETGILLKWGASSGGEGGTFEATEVGDPKDSDFTPPATPTTTPDISDLTIPGGYTVP
jgi:hypothetical protein